MIIDQTFHLDKWTRWTDFIYESGILFYEAHGFFPNILLMNRHTHSQINFVVIIDPAARLHVYDTQPDENIGEDEPIELCCYICDEFTLEFGFTEDVEDREFVFMYDTNPFWNNDNDDDDTDEGGDENEPIQPDPVPDYVEF